MCCGIGLCISTVLGGVSGTRALRGADFRGQRLFVLRVTPFSGRITWLGFCGKDFFQMLKVIPLLIYALNLGWM
jgi:predicted small integral membrane protein